MSERLVNTLTERFGDVEIQPIAGGHTLAERGLADLPGLGRCFVKAGYDDRTRAALATEAAVLSEVESPHLPNLIRHEPGLLIVEDLSHAHWPPPWLGDPHAVWTALEGLASSAAPSMAVPIEGEGRTWDGIDRAGEVLGEPLTHWLEEHLDRLTESALAVSPAGSDFVHADLSLENLCVASRGVVIIDWEFASIGNRELDIATVSLELVAGGLDPAEVPLTDPTSWAARLATWLLAGSIGLSEWAVDPEALRADRLNLAEAALRWWAKNLGLSAPPPARVVRRSV